MHFEWDPKKREANLEKHGIDFLRAVRIFEGFVHEWQDTRKDYGEIRTISLGQVDEQILTVIHTPRGQAIRIIPARRANRDEEADYCEVRSRQA